MNKQQKTSNKKQVTTNNEKVNAKLPIDFTSLANELATATKTSDGTKKSLVRTMNKYNAYTSTTATDTVNYSDLYIQLNVTDKPRIWLRKNGFNLQYDKNAKRDNRTEFYESLATEYNFKYTDTPSFANRNRTSDILNYDLLATIMKHLFENGIMSTI